MDNKKLSILAIIAAAMVALAVLQSKLANRPPQDSAAASGLIQGLDPADIGRIVVGVGDKAVTLVRSGSRFLIANRDNYPAKNGAINELVGNCLKIVRGERVTGNPDNFKDLEVTEEDARSVVKFYTSEPNSPLLVGLVIGKTRDKGEGNYVRVLTTDVNASNQVYVGTEVPWLDSSVADFFDSQILKLERKDISSATVASPDGSYTLKLADPNSEDVVMVDLPEGKKLKKTESESIFTALLSVRFDDVTKDDGGITFDKKYTCTLKNSTVYTVDVGEKDGDIWTKFAAEYAGEVPTSVGRTESEEQLKDKEAKLLARDKAVEFTKRHKGWVYKLPSYKKGYLTEGRDKLLEDLPDPNKTITDAELDKPVEVEKPAEPNTPAPVEAQPAEPAPAEPNTPAPADVKPAEPNTPPAVDPNS